MNQQIRRERHFIFPDLLDQIPESKKLANGSIRCILVVVDVTFSILDVGVQPPTHGLHFRIPGVHGVVAMTIVAGTPEDCPDTVGDRELLRDTLGSVLTAEIFFWPDKLYGDKGNGENKAGQFENFHRDSVRSLLSVTYTDSSRVITSAADKKFATRNEDANFSGCLCLATFRDTMEQPWTPTETRFK